MIPILLVVTMLKKMVCAAVLLPTMFYLGLTDTTGIERPGKVRLTDEEWKAKLSKQEYSVCRKHGTEQV